MSHSNDFVPRIPDPQNNDFRNPRLRIAWTPPTQQPSTKVSISSAQTGVSDFKGKLATTDLIKPVYAALTAHQREEAEWVLHHLFEFLDEWWQILTDWATLDIPRTPLSLVQNLRRTCLGYFRPGHNELGLRGEIAIGVPTTADGQLDLDTLDLGDMIGTEFHEQLHLDQALHGFPSRHNHHNLAFRDKARRFGLIVDYRGHQKYDPDGAFLDLLRRHGVPLPRSMDPLSQHQKPKRPKSGRSTLKKWSCGCTNVWVGVAELMATCLRCEKQFARE